MAALVPVAFSLRWVWRWRSVAGQVFWETEIYLLPSLVLGNLLNAVSGAIFGVTITVVAAGLTRRIGG